MRCLELGKLSEGVMNGLDEREIVKRDPKSREVEHLRHEAGVSESDLVAYTVLALGSFQDFFNRT